MAVKNSSETAGARTPAGRPRSSVATILFTALGVLVIAACAVVLSYNGIYRIAVQGNVEPRYSHLYPAVFTLLVLMALWTGYTLRTAPRAQRLWADGLILLLVAVAAGASALEASDLVLVPAVATVAAAVAPWLALLVAFRLFLSVVMHLRGEVPGTGPRRVRRRRAGDAPEPAAEPHSADPPDGEPGTERDRSFAASFGAPDAPEPGRETAPATASADEHADEHADRAVADGDDGEDGEDGRAPRPRAPESADFRDPALRPPRPAPVERPSRPERPSSLEPPESAQEPDPDPQRTRRGFLGRRSDGAGRQQAPAAGTPAEADGAAEGPAESGSPGDGGPTDEAAPLWTDTADAGSETVGAAPVPAR
ncbi:DUF2637 domain-containing protein, partial [Streptomonospora salina]|uniref:DUF2637 domain-containing protein n=1 Tax=Streptomonospora salina TaxID=104205 RepID=UPI0035F07D3E